MESNVQKMREALKKDKELVDSIGAAAIAGELNEDAIAIVMANASARIEKVLSAPLRNCDVGTAWEQYGRFLKWCKRRVEMTDDCSGCPAYQKQYNNFSCQIEWAQMPYTEGGAE